MIYLGRAMTMSGGFDTDAAFQLDPDGVGGRIAPVPALQNGAGKLFWEGISQGAIMGGALTALEPDLTQSVLNVTGMNYSTLLRRSSDSGQYLDIAGHRALGPLPEPAAAAADPVPDAAALGPRRGQWVRGAHDERSRCRTPPAHHVLLQMAYGDHQVSNLAGEVEARTIGAQVHTPELDDRTALGRGSALRADGDRLLPVQRGRGDGLLRRRAARLSEPCRGHCRIQTCTDENTTRTTGPRRRRWWSCPPIRRACTAAIRTRIRGGRSTASRTTRPGCSPAGSSTSAGAAQRGRVTPTASPARPRPSR